MAPLPLKGGFYVARNLIANAQRCVNLYPEKNPEDSPQPYTMLLTPGLTILGAGAPQPGTWRGLFFATNGMLYGVLNQAVYYIDANWGFNQIGALLGAVSTPVGMADNGAFLTIVDGSPQGYQVDLTNNAFSQIADPNFLGGTHAGVLDTFLLYNQPATRNFYSSLSGLVQFDPTYFAAKSGYPDNLAALLVMHREIWLLGAQRTSEIWYNAGGATFPFAIQPSIFIEQGCVAPYSTAKHDLKVFWLGLDKDGKNTVFQGSNYTANKISTPAIAALLSKLVRVDDAIGMTYKQQDHVFYMLTFPSADRTIVYDVTEGLWHERSFNDVNGVEHRHRANCMCAVANSGYPGTIVAGDFMNGNLYAMDLDNYTDFGAPIVRRRSFPHLLNDGKRQAYNAFRADMDMGGLFPGGDAQFASNFTQFNADQVYLRWSDDRGHTWGNPVGQPLGANNPQGGMGGYLSQAQWRQLGSARDRVFELFWSPPVNTALQGAWVDATPAAS